MGRTGIAAFEAAQLISALGGQMANDEVDVGALMADIDRFGAWWVRIDEGEVEVCLHDPGDEVDVYFTSTLRTLTEVRMGDVPLLEARRQGALKIVGREAWLRNLSAWFPLHVLAVTPRSPRELSC